MSYLHDNTAHEFEHAGLYVRIVSDTEPAFNPRTDYDSPSVWWGEGGEEKFAALYYDVGQWIREKRLEGASVIPVRYSDYGSSGARLYETDLDDANGAFVCDREAVREEWGEGNGKRQGHNGARAYMRAEIEEMDLFLQGHVFGVVVCPDEDSDEQLDAVWGFIGEPDADWIIQEASRLAEGVRDSLDTATAKEHEASRWAARNGIATVA